MQALRAFEAAARTGSLTKAADSLSLTHGAISHQIKALEATVGVALVERAGRGIRLTADGERLATRLRAALGDIADALREAGERSDPRRLRVSVTPSFAARWLLPRLGRFISRHTDIDLDVRSSIALVDFRRDDADVAIRYGHGTWDDVHAAQPDVVVVAPCGYDREGSQWLADDLAASGVLPAGVPVHAVDANASWARPGTRLVDGVEELARLLHPPTRS